MMKKLLALMLVMLLAFAACTALAEDTQSYTMYLETIQDTDVTLTHTSRILVDVTPDMPDNYLSAMISRQDVAAVHLTIAPSELYEGLSMGDLSEEERQNLKEIAASQYDTPTFEEDITPSGNLYLHICSGEESDIDAIFTLYKGFFVELVQYHEDFSALTEADDAFLHELLYGLNFNDAEEMTEYDDSLEYEGGDPANSPDFYLKSNPSTGYTWVGSSSDENVAYVVDNGFDPDGTDLVGGPGISSLRIDGLNPGFATITFSYARPWETDVAPLYTMVLDVSVDEELNVTIFAVTYQFD